MFRGYWSNVIQDKLKIAKVVLILYAILFGVIGGAVVGLFLSAFAYDSGPNTGRALVYFSVIFFPVSILSSVFCYGAYKSLDSDNSFLQVVFWLFIAWNIPAIPVGSAIAILLIYLWYKIKQERTLLAQPQHAE